METYTLYADTIKLVLEYSSICTMIVLMEMSV